MPTGYTILPYSTVLPEQVLAYFGITIDDDNKVICPFHADTQPSMLVNKDYVYCFGCKQGFDVWRLAEALLKDSSINIGKWLQTTNFPSPSGRVYRTSKYKGVVNNSLVEYWHLQLVSNPDLMQVLQTERLFTPDTINKFQLGYRPDKNAWVIPFQYKGQTDIVQFRSRCTDDSGKKYWGLEGHQHGSLINRSILDVPQEYVVVLLGAYDSLLADQDGLPAVGLNGSMPFKKTEKEKVQDIFSKQKLVFVVPDNNECEYDSARTLAEWLKAEVRYFPTELPHNCDYIDYRKLGKTPEDFKREVLGILPYEDIQETELFASLCSLFDKGDKLSLAEMHLQWYARGISYADVAIALAIYHVKNSGVKRLLLSVKDKAGFEQVMHYNFRLQGGW